MLETWKLKEIGVWVGNLGKIWKWIVWTYIYIVNIKIFNLKEIQNTCGMYSKHSATKNKNTIPLVKSDSISVSYQNNPWIQGAHCTVEM